MRCYWNESLIKTSNIHMTEYSVVAGLLLCDVYKVRFLHIFLIKSTDNINNIHAQIINVQNEVSLKSVSLGTRTYVPASAGGEPTSPAQPLRHFSSQIKLDLSVLPIGTSKRNNKCKAIYSSSLLITLWAPRLNINDKLKLGRCLIPQKNFILLVFCSRKWRSEFMILN